MNTSDTRRFGGISRLFGSNGLEKLSQSHVVIVGVGGVGSWVAEALARTAVGRLTLIDGDTVEESNTNRQLPALDGCYGRKKVEVLGERIKAINPQVGLEIKATFLCAENFEELIPACDVLIDCIDSLQEKTLLVARAKTKARYVLTSGGAGGKVDASRVAFDDVAYVRGDSLVAAMRTKLRKEYGFPKGRAGSKPERFNIGAVYSDEPVRASQDQGEGFGVFMAVTTTFAMKLAQVCVEKLLQS